MTLKDLMEWSDSGCPVKLADGTMAYADCQFSGVTADHPARATITLWEHGAWLPSSADDEAYLAANVMGPPTIEELVENVEIDFRPRDPVKTAEQAKAARLVWNLKVLHERLEQ